MGIVVVMLNFAATWLTCSPARGPGEHAPVGRPADRDLGVASGGMEARELSAEQLGPALGVVDDLGGAGELERGVFV